MADIHPLFTSIRREVVSRLGNDRLFTLEECKLLLKEILKRARIQAQRDMDHLLFLCHVRRTVCLDKPLKEDVIVAPEEMENDPLDPTLPEVVVEPAERSLFQDEGRVLAYPHAHLSHLVIHINRSLVHLIDALLEQRKRRMLLAATILEDIGEGAERG